MAEMERIIGRIELQGVNGIGKYALVSLCDLDNLSQYTWFVTSDGYVNTTIAGEKDYRMHRLIMGLDARRTEDIEVDHINHNRLDNTRSNLRIATSTQNKCNQAKKQTINGKPTSSQFKGVCWNKEKQKWQAHIQANKKKHYLGSFDDEVQAALAYDNASRQLHGSFGNPNFPVQPVINITNNYYSGPPNQ